MKITYKKQVKGMKIFTTVWIGQLVSIMGTAMTKFAFIIWAYEQTGKASTIALLGFFNILPYIIVSPIAGVLVDRFDRKKIMILADTGAAIITAMLLIFYLSGNLHVWHLFLGEALAGAFEAFQIPAYTSAITMLLPKEQYGRASGMRSFAKWSSQILAPILGGFLMVRLGIRVVMIIDIITFFVAMTTLMVVIIPRPEVERKDINNQKSMWQDMRFGFDYLKNRRGLFLLMLVFVGMNFFAGMTYFGILPAMVLARSGSDRMVLASVQAALGIGGVIGSLIVSVWGCPKEKIAVILIAAGATYIFGDIWIALSPTVYGWVVAGFLSSFFLPFVIGAETILWQSKVEPNIQGRIFSMKGMLQLASLPAGYIAGGFLADSVFEPLMMGDNSLSQVFGKLVGTGTGSGMALMFLFTGVLGTLICIISYFIGDIRNLEMTLPDHDVKPLGDY